MLEYTVLLFCAIFDNICFTKYFDACFHKQSFNFIFTIFILCFRSFSFALCHLLLPNIDPSMQSLLMLGLMNQFM